MKIYLFAVALVLLSSSVLAETTGHDVRFVRPAKEVDRQLLVTYDSQEDSIPEPPPPPEPDHERELSHVGNEPREDSSEDGFGLTGTPKRWIGYEEKYDRCYLQFIYPDGSQDYVIVRSRVKFTHNGKVVTCRQEIDPPSWFLRYFDIPKEENRDISSVWWDVNGNHIGAAYARYKWHGSSSDYKLKIIIEKEE